MSISKLEVHPAAAIFPMMSDEELAELGESIKAHGLREKIQVIPKGEDGATLVIDGRNRLEAIRRTLKLSDEEIIKQFVQGITFVGKNYTPEEYVVMSNIERRNLTQAQRRDLAGKLAVMLSERQKHLPKEERTDTTADAARMAGVSRRTAATAKKAATTKEPAKKSTTPQEPRPVNVIQQLEAARKTLRKKKAVDKWTTPQLREAYVRAKDIVDIMTKLDEGRTLPGDKIIV